MTGKREVAWSFACWKFAENAPGGAQVYYGDELARPLQVPGANGDANLRSPMNWPDLASGGRAATTLEHWRRLGRFRRAHPAVGAGAHQTLQASPFIFSRTLDADRVLVALDQPAGRKTIQVFGLFADGTTLTDGYSGQQATVTGGTVTLTTPDRLLLLSR